jgi:hypothetical protein
MTKRALAPKGFYTASDVMKILGIRNSTLYHYVNTGKIRKVVPPDRKEGYYVKSDVDKLAKAKELFLLQYTSDTSVFRKADEQDIKAIHDLAVSIFGANIVPSYENRLAPYLKNPNIYYILEQDNIIVGFLGIMPIKQNIIDRILGEKEEAKTKILTTMSEIVTPDNISMFKPGEAENIYLIAVVRQNLTKSKIYGMRIIMGAYEVIKEYAQKGVFIKKLYAVSRIADGIKLCKDMGFREIIVTGNPVHRFELDLEKTKSPHLHEYQQLVKEQETAKATASTEQAILTPTSPK